MKITTPSPGMRIGLSEIRLDDVNLYTSGDPHLVWQTLRTECPVFWQDLGDGGSGFWAVTLWADVRRVLGEHATFTSERGTAISMLAGSDPAAGKMMQATDPPRHQELRKSIGTPFSARSIHSFKSKIRSFVREIVNSASNGDVWDIARGFSRLPMRTAAMLMGLPDDDVDRLLCLAYSSLAPLDPEYALGTEMKTLFLAHSQLLEYFTKVIEERRKKASNDVISHLIDIEIDGCRLNDSELYLNCLSLILGAVVTTSHVISATIMELISFNAGEGRWPRNVQIGDLVDEALRWSSPVTHFMRRARRNTEINGIKIREGDAVTAWIASANRDPDIFEQPYMLNPMRNPNRHVAFGSGPHLCVGGNLARMMLTHSFEELISSIESFESAAPVRHLVSNEIAGIVSMPLRVRLRSPQDRVITYSRLVS